MRYLLKFSSFESYVDDLGSGEQLQGDKKNNFEDILKEFNQKKGALESIFKGRGDDQKLKSDILSKVYSGNKNSQNKLLNKLENILWMERSIQKISDKNKDYSSRKSELDKKLMDLQKILTVAEGKLKEETGKSMVTVQSEIASIKDSTKTNEEKLKEIEEKLKKEKEDFSRFEKEIYTKVNDEK